MRRLSYIVFAFVFLLAMVIPSYASVGVKEEGVMEGATTDIDFVGGANNTYDGTTKKVDLSKVDSLTSTTDITFRDILVGLGRVAASSSLACSSTPTGLTNLPYVVIRKFMGAGPGSWTLPAGTSGQIVTITMVLSQGGTWTVTHDTGTPASNWTSFTMNTAGQTVTLYYDAYNGWVIIAYTGATVTWNTNKQ
jgi:hypothetical protein